MNDESEPIYVGENLGSAFCPECETNGKKRMMLCQQPQCGANDTYFCPVGHVIDHHPRASIETEGAPST